MITKLRVLFLSSVLVLLIAASSPLSAQGEPPSDVAASGRSTATGATETDTQPAVFPIMQCGATYDADITVPDESRFWTIEPQPGRPFTVIASTEQHPQSSVDTVLTLWSVNAAMQVVFHTANDDMDGLDSWLHFTPAYNNTASPTGARYDVELYDFFQVGGEVDLYWDYVTYFSTRTSGNIGRLAYTPGDILAYDYCRDSFRMVFDASDLAFAGRRNVTDMALVNSWTFAPNRGGILMTFANSNDVTAFYATNLGSTTTGFTQPAFDGSDVGLTTTAERLDGLAVSDADLMLGTKSKAAVPGLKFAAEDLVRFTPSSLGNVTAGAYTWEFDGSDESLNPRIGQPLGIWHGLDHEHHKLSGHWDDQWYITFDKGVNVTPGLLIPPDRIAICRAENPAPNTSCIWSLDSYFPGIPGSNPVVDGIDKGSVGMSSTLSPLPAPGESHKPPTQ